MFKKIYLILYKFMPRSSLNNILFYETNKRCNENYEGESVRRHQEVIVPRGIIPYKCHCSLDRGWFVPMSTPTPQ